MNEAKVLSKPFSDLCNLSITSDKFLEIFKIADLKPFYKKGSLTEPCNYRPISLLPLISEVIEKPFTLLSIRFSKISLYGFLLFLFE